MRHPAATATATAAMGVAIVVVKYAESARVATAVEINGERGKENG